MWGKSNSNKVGRKSKLSPEIISQVIALFKNGTLINTTDGVGTSNPHIISGNYNIKTLAEHELASGRCIYSKYSASQKRCSAGTLTRVNVPETIDWLFNVFPGTLNSQLEEACHMTTNWTVTLTDLHKNQRMEYANLNSRWTMES
ncbi:hypothetical protein BB558_007108 [Smittium angustum]|uniref:Uncharacterized protein n=1 Tax=Smittium angustum TaxID=133377 RepID=A0A2U1IVX3_SMIAN|nr:hypothetical protein BB558_007108 [Smittium angustum]